MRALGDVRRLHWYGTVESRRVAASVLQVFRMTPIAGNASRRYGALMEYDGEYANVSVAVSRELVRRAKAIRKRERMLLSAEVQRRLRLPLDQWAPAGALDELTRGARAHLHKAVTPKL